MFPSKSTRLVSKMTVAIYSFHTLSSHNTETVKRTTFPLFLTEVFIVLLFPPFSKACNFRCDVLNMPQQMFATLKQAKNAFEAQENARIAVSSSE